MWKKIAQVLVWVMLLFSFIHAVGDRASAKKNQPVVVKAEAPFDYAAVSFATAYAKEYLTWWVKDGTREARLAKFESSQTGINRVVIGDVGKAQGVRGTWPMSMEVIDENHVIIKLMVDTICDNKQRYLEMTVPLIRNEDGFGVYANSSLRSYPGPIKENKRPKYGEGVKAELIVELKPVLEGFFKAYLVGQTPEEVSNFVSGKTKILPLASTWQFRNLTKFEAFEEVPDASKIVVVATVEVADPLSGAILYMDYTLRMVLANGKYFIASIR